MEVGARLLWQPESGGISAARLEKARRIHSDEQRTRRLTGRPPAVKTRHAPLTTAGRGRVTARRGLPVGGVRFLPSGAAPSLPKLRAWAGRAGHKTGPSRTEFAFGRREWARFCVRHAPNGFGRPFGRRERRCSYHRCHGACARRLYHGETQHPH